MSHAGSTAMLLLVWWLSAAAGMVLHSTIT
jgi:hypothetical protein